MRALPFIFLALITSALSQFAPSVCVRTCIAPVRGTCAITDAACLCPTSGNYYRCVLAKCTAADMQALRQACAAVKTVVASSSAVVKPLTTAVVKPSTTAAVVTKTLVTTKAPITTAIVKATPSSHPARSSTSADSSSETSETITSTASQSHSGVASVMAGVIGGVLLLALLACVTICIRHRRADVLEKKDAKKYGIDGKRNEIDGPSSGYPGLGYHSGQSQASASSLQHESQTSFAPPSAPYNSRPYNSRSQSWASKSSSFNSSSSVNHYAPTPHATYNHSNLSSQYPSSSTLPLAASTTTLPLAHSTSNLPLSPSLTFTSNSASSPTLPWAFSVPVVTISEPPSPTRRSEQSRESNDTDRSNEAGQSRSSNELAEMRSRIASLEAKIAGSVGSKNDSDAGTEGDPIPSRSAAMKALQSLAVRNRSTDEENPPPVYTPQ
ncbi:hypothetical protein C8J56DRAFT_1049343 [Mycena floridula]|nr:hypothetical protein C8J56DRAFT_1049343 [Mycena floridula]